MKARRTMHIVYHRESGTIHRNDEPPYRGEAYDMVELIEASHPHVLGICLAGNVMSGCTREQPRYDMVQADKYESRNNTLRDLETEVRFRES